MANVLIKRGKFLEGHSVCMGSYSFEWTHDEALARRFHDDDPNVGFFSRITASRVEPRPNTRQELRELGRRRMAERLERDALRPPDVHDRINARVLRIQTNRCGWCGTWLGSRVFGGHHTTRCPKLRRDRSMGA